MVLPVRPPFEPMLAKLTRALPPEGAEVLYEPKWDGFRCVLFRDGDQLDLHLVLAAGATVELMARDAAKAARVAADLERDAPGRVGVVVADTGVLHALHAAGDAEVYGSLDAALGDDTPAVRAHKGAAAPFYIGQGDAFVVSSEDIAGEHDHH